MKTDKRRIVYSGHLKLRMLLRGIPTEVPRIIYDNTERIFRNKLTEHRIAVGKVTMDGRERSLMVVYDIARNGRLF